jgi:tyrosyl-tRNA synthetase
MNMPSISSASSTVLDQLRTRDRIADSTDLSALDEALSGRVTLYCGFDPTAPSLHMGSLATLLELRRFQQAGHRPIVLVGGATGLIGDPKASGERALNSRELVRAWVEQMTAQVSRFVDLEGANAALVVDNFSWTQELDVLSFLRDIGKHFSVNRMLDREAVAARLAGDGISFTEFSYQLLQSYDYLELHRRYGCTLQIGGSDQWGNITAGVDLIRRVTGERVHAMTMPLVTKADGTKYGKTESGTVWLDAELTSPWLFYQFWLNAADEDSPMLLRTFSMKTLEEVNALIVESEATPAARLAQRALAHEVTALVHGASTAESVEAAASALFGAKSREGLAGLHELNPDVLASALAETPGRALTSEEIADGVDAVTVLVAAGVVDSKGAARRAIAEGGAYVNNERVTSEDAVFTVSDLVHDRWLVARRGKRTVGGVDASSLVR